MTTGLVLDLDFFLVLVLVLVLGVGVIVDIGLEDVDVSSIGGRYIVIVTLENEVPIMSLSNI